MFLVGGILLPRGAGTADEEEAETEAEFGAKAAGQVVGWRVVTLCFTVLFLAEWGDLSQLLTASLVVRYDDPVSVFVGAFGSLAVAGLAAALGRTLLPGCGCRRSAASVARSAWCSPPTPRSRSPASSDRRRAGPRRRTAEGG